MKKLIFIPLLFLCFAAFSQRVYTSETLTTQAWKVLEKKEYVKTDIYASKCISLFSEKAYEMQMVLKGPVDSGENFKNRDETFAQWALNDVATCYFIKGLALRHQKKEQQAKEIFQFIAENFRCAQCWDLEGWFWKPAEGARDQIVEMEKGVDFGDYTSETLTTNAWKAWDAGEYEKVEIYIDKCFSLFEKKAHEMQAGLRAPVEAGKNLQNRKEVFQQWALNDVATCYFIKGLLLRELDREKEAKKTFAYVSDNFSYAQCWDPKGWFWKPAEGAEDQVVEMEKGVDFGNYTSEDLTIRAWNALGIQDYGKVQIYTEKCISLFEEKAHEMQAALKGPVDPGRALENKQEVFKYWALNDVAICYFIKGLSAMRQSQDQKAKEIFQHVTKNFRYAQSWDPMGWFWKPAEGARDQIVQMKKGVDFGNYTSEHLTIRAWNALETEDHEKVQIYTDKCISLFEEKAIEMQADLKTPVDLEKNVVNKDGVFQYWALNDVATCYFIKGFSLRKQKQNKEAKEIFMHVAENFSYAQCWDPKGWFWKPAEGARDQILGMAKGVDFGNYTSESLTVSAWSVLQEKDYEKV